MSLTIINKRTSRLSLASSFLVEWLPLKPPLYIISFISFECQFVFLRTLPDADGVAWLQAFFHQQFAESVFHVVLDSSLQWASAELNIIALGCHEFLGLVGHLEAVTLFFHTFYQLLQLQVHYALDGIDVELVEGDNLVETVQKLWGKLLGKALLNHASCVFLVLLADKRTLTAQSAGIEAHATAKFLDRKSVV